MGEILATGGKEFLLPVSLFFLTLYAARGLFGIHGRRSQNRKEFLELWSEARAQSDLWLEVSVRHLFGTFLPAHIIRLALKQPDRGQALAELSELWPLLHLDRDTLQVRWLYRRHCAPKRRRFVRALVSIAYFACAGASIFGARLAFHYGSDSFSGWLYGVGAIVSGITAYICLAREDAMKTAVRVGEEWLTRINTDIEHKPSSTQR
jgi:hypothetical protein